MRVINSLYHSTAPHNMNTKINGRITIRLETQLLGYKLLLESECWVSTSRIDIVCIELVSRDLLLHLAACKHRHHGWGFNDTEIISFQIYGQQ